MVCCPPEFSLLCNAVSSDVEYHICYPMLLEFTNSVHWDGWFHHSPFLCSNPVPSLLLLIWLLLQSLKLWTQRTPLYLHHSHGWTLTVGTYCICLGRTELLCFLVSTVSAKFSRDKIFADRPPANFCGNKFRG